MAPHIATAQPRCEDARNDVAKMDQGGITARRGYTTRMQAIQVALGPDGVPRYAIPCPPEKLPGVAPAALRAAWEAARAEAAAGRWGTPREMLFADTDGDTLRLAITDRDACCWASAVDRQADLGTLSGLALCLRLLALIEVLSRSRGLSALLAMTPEGAVLPAGLLRAAAAMPLDSAARFDAEALSRLLSRRLSASGSGLGLKVA